MAETTTVNPPSFQLPYLQYGMEQARGLYETGGPNYFPNKTYVPFSGQTEAALGLTENRALMGSPVDRAMQSYITGTLGNTGMGQPAFNYYSNMMNQFSGSPYGTPQMSQPFQNPMAQSPMLPSPPLSSYFKNVTPERLQKAEEERRKYLERNNGVDKHNLADDVYNFMSKQPGDTGYATGGPVVPEFLKKKTKPPSNQVDSGSIVTRVTRGGQPVQPTPPDPMTARPMPSQPMANAVPAPAVPRPLPPNPFNLNAAQNQIDATLSGNYLNANPYLDQAFDLASKKVTDAYTKSVIPALNASFAGAGGSGSGIQRELALDASERLGTSLGSLASDIYGQNYQAERGRQADAASIALNNAINQGKLGLDAAAGYGNLLSQIGTLQGRAAQLAPTASALDYANIDRLGGVGQAVEGKANQILQDQINRFNYYQNRPEQNLANYMGYITGNYGQDQTTNFDKGSSALNALGGASVLGSLFNELGGQGAGWWGAGLGALGGLLAS